MVYPVKLVSSILDAANMVMTNSIIMAWQQGSLGSMCKSFSGLSSSQILLRKENMQKRQSNELENLKAVVEASIL